MMSVSEKACVKSACEKELMIPTGVTSHDLLWSHMTCSVVT